MVHRNMKVLLVLAIISVCKAQFTTKQSTVQHTCSGDSALHEEVRLLREELRRSNAKLNETLNTRINTELNKLQTQIEDAKRGRDTTPVSAFLVKGLDHNAKVYNSGEKVVFASVVYNHGNHYNTGTGVYSCPLTGFYFFSYTVYGYQIKAGESYKVSVGLMKSSELQAELYVRFDGTENFYTTPGQSLIVQCNAGETVCIKSEHSGTRLYGLADRNSFSGFLLISSV